MMRRTQNPQQTLFESVFLSSPLLDCPLNIPSLEGERSPEPSSVGEGREQAKAEEERKGVGKARNVPTLVNFSWPQF